MNEMKWTDLTLLNLPPHDININGRIYPASGDVARVSVAQEDTGKSVYGIRVRKNRYGKVMVGDITLATFMEENRAPVLVSGMVIDALKKSWATSPNAGVYAPDPGPTAVRNNQGHIEYVTGVIGL